MRDMVFPTHVGMNRRHEMAIMVAARVFPTHVGMNRLTHAATDQACECSPRMWG